MGMVKRVLYTATGGSCRDPEAVSWSRNKTGAIDVTAQGGWILIMTFKTHCVWNNMFGIRLMSQLISSFSLEMRFREDVSANLLTFIKNCLMSQLICSISMLMAQDSHK